MSPNPAHIAVPATVASVLGMVIRPLSAPADSLKAQMVAQCRILKNFTIRPTSLHWKS